LLSMPAAIVMKRYNYKTGLLIGLSLYSLGSLLFYPAALSQQYSFFLLSLFVIASGLAFLETGANSFIAAYGDPDTSERRLNFAQAFNPLGSITGILIGTTFIFSGNELTLAEKNDLRKKGEYSAYLEREIMQVVMPYLVLGVVVIVLAVAVWKTKFPDVSEEAEEEVETTGYGSSTPRRESKFIGLIRSHPHFIRGVLAQFCYVGAQVGTWSYYIQYLQDYADEKEKAAGYYLTGTLGFFLGSEDLLQHIS